MRKLLYIFSALVIAVSCENEIPLKIEDDSDVLILNASLCSDEQQHSIFLSRGNLSEIVLENDAEINIYINGEFVAKAQQDVKDNSRHQEYKFTATFNPGDLVKIDVKSGNLSAYSEVEVPQTAEFTSAKLDTIKVMVFDQIQDMLVITAGIKDVEGTKNWYKIDLLSFATQQTTYYNIETQAVREVIVDTSNIMPVYFDATKDQIISDGYTLGAMDDNNPLGQLSLINHTNVFSDRLFADGQAEFVLEDIYPSSIAYIYFGGYEQPLENEAVETIITPHLKLRLRSITQDTYNYYRAINAAEALSYEANILTEPINFPTNVAGGLGFVEVSSSTVHEFVLPSRSLDDWGGYYY